MAYRVINPILPGFYPDPSMCVAEGEYYLVCSSFSYFPGLPIFKSKDLVRWEQIGNIIDRSEQMDFEGGGVSRGLFAPTIRYYNKKFYCVCTQVDKIGNFIVTADNPAGPWSNPVIIKDAPGIDPSLFFDDDGTCWYVGTRPVPEGPQYNGNWEIWIQKLDPNNGVLYGESKGIWRGALRRCIWPEGPHIYKFFGKYYLIHAEGGTGLDHAVCVARSEKIDGEWIGKPANPIFTHRHLGAFAGIINVGHADIVCSADNKWWMCCLASRPYGEGERRASNLGRETFLVPVKWENDWPVVSWETGLVEQSYSLSGHVVQRSFEDADAAIFPSIDDFNAPVLDKYWLSLRSRNEEFITCAEKSGILRIYGGKHVSSADGVNLVARRQTAFSYEASAQVSCNFAQENDAAGIICFQSEKFNYRLQLVSRGKLCVLQVVKATGGDDEILAEIISSVKKNGKPIVLRVVAEHQNLRFEYGLDERNMNVILENADASVLSSEKAGGFVGSLAGMFATSVAAPNTKQFYADFDWFKYQNNAKEWICK